MKSSLHFSIRNTMVFGRWGLRSCGYGAAAATLAIPEDAEVLKALLWLWEIVDINKLLASRIDAVSEGIWNYIRSAILTTVVLLKVWPFLACAIFGVGYTPVVSR
jgi:hypothetical protein